ncbi:MAG: glycosyltransferase family 8 protein [Alphaproteobacteria bacterium]|nr:glycosyltransferase family 8 protein [Alphaproteobacteria bacterium]
MFNILKNKCARLLIILSALVFLVFYLFFCPHRLPSTPAPLAPNAEDIHVVFNIDENYAKFLSVTMISILQNTDEHLHFHILTNGLSASTLKKIEKLKKIKPFELDIIKINDERIAQIPDYVNITINSVANYRLLTASLLPDLDKIIYLDADLVFQSNIKEYWHIDVNNYYLAAVADPLNGHQEKEWFHDLPLPDKSLYFNSGVPVINLKKWREDGVENKFFENSAKYAKLLVLPDQDILNITLSPDVKYLNLRYNFTTELRFSDAKTKAEFAEKALLIHWAGVLKPWLIPGNLKAELFWHYAEYSPFYPEIARIYYVSVARLLFKSLFG